MKYQYWNSLAHGVLAFALTLQPAATTHKTSQANAEVPSLPAGLPADEWVSIRAACEASPYAAFAFDGGRRARNAWQQLTMFFDGRGFDATPDAGGWSWGLELRRYGWGEHMRELSTPRAVGSAGARVAYEWDDRLSEWYVNDRRGLEHGFTLHTRPQDAGGMLTLLLSIRGGLSPMVSPDGLDVRFVNQDGISVLTYTGLAVHDADGRSLTASWRAHVDGLQLSVLDHTAHYPLTIDPIVQQAYLKASNTGADDEFAYSLSLSGDTLAVGAWLEDSNATGVNGDQSNNLATDSGAVYIFVRNGSSWSQQAYLKASNTGVDDYFGFALSLSGDTLIVGAYREDSSAVGVNGNQGDNGTLDSGAAYVFSRSGTTWSQQAYLKASNTGAGDQFGRAVSASVDRLAVGSWFEDSSATGANGDQTNNSALDSGAVYLFERSGTTWSQQAYLKASNTGADDRFGVPLTIWGNTLAVGAYSEDSNATGVNGNQASNSASNSGAVFVFSHNGATWSQQAYLKASNTESSDWFGWSLALSGNTLAVGAYREDSLSTGVNGDQTNNGAPDAGAVYVFVSSGSSWSQQAYVKASNAWPSDWFGYSVSLSADVLAVGAWLEDSNATGVNGDQSNNSAESAGAAYLFTRSGTAWSQTAYLKASNTAMNDSFAYSLSIWGATLAAGAIGEDSNATGVNGDQSNNLASSSGAAYVFDLGSSPCVPPIAYCASLLSSSACLPAMGFSGTPSFGNPSGFTVTGSQLEANMNGLMFFGTLGSNNAPFLGGTLCVKAPLYRLTIANTGGAGACTGSLSRTLADMIAHPSGGSLVVVGAQVNAQIWTRDPPASGTVSLSNGIQFSVCP